MGAEFGRFPQNVTVPYDLLRVIETKDIDPGVFEVACQIWRKRRTTKPPPRDCV